MATALTDRFHLLARAGQVEKTPIRAEAPATKTADGVAVLRLYDVLDSWGGPYGVSAKEFADVLDALPDDTTEIQLHVNSPGGEVWEGLAILNLLRQHKAKVVAVVDGLAASAASFVCMGAEEVVMSANSELMVHSPWGLCVGNAIDMQKMADDLNHEGKNLAAIYAGKAGGTVDEWLTVMAAETWFSDAEAVAAGLADRIDTKPADSKTKARFDLSVFAYAGRAHAPAPQAPVSTAGGSVPHEGGSAVAFSDEQITALRQRLGVADDADEATILAALDEALKEQAEPEATPDGTPDGTPDEVTPAALAEVTRLSSELAELKASQSKRDKDELFASWLRDGKTSPAERTQLEQMYDAAPAQTASLVNARAKGSVVPVNEIGHDDGTEVDLESAEFDRLFPKEVTA